MADPIIAVWQTARGRKRLELRTNVYGKYYWQTSRSRGDLAGDVLSHILWRAEAIAKMMDHKTQRVL